MPPEPVEELTDAQRSLRAAMLATEHWSVLATRSTTQSELLSRITIFLTLVSAGLLALGLFGNATKFSSPFPWIAVGILSFLSLVGLLSSLRLFNGSTEDLAHVIAMNRLRGAYIDLDPGLEKYLLASPYDDETGWGRTYFPFADRSASQVLASAGFLVVVVETVLVSTLSGVLVALAAGRAAGLVVGLVLLPVLLLLAMGLARQQYRRIVAQHRPLKVTPS